LAESKNSASQSMEKGEAAKRGLLSESYDQSSEEIPEDHIREPIDI
jgi:hypothetical protein